MNGRARSSAAVSFVNALATGVGAAAGICVFADVELTIAPARRSTFRTDARDKAHLLRATAAAALRAWSSEPEWATRVRVRSDIPVGKGLKSSSAVGTATAAAVADALHRAVTSEEIAAIAADAALAVGQSATGAFDDALASREPGIHVTDNRMKRRLRSDSIDPDLRVLLWVPREPHRPSPEYADAFSAASTEGKRAEEEARAGRPFEAMRRNTVLVERLLRYDYAGLRGGLARHGALGCGVTGLGPTLVAVAPSGRVAELRRLFEGTHADVIETRFCRPGDLALGLPA